MQIQQINLNNRSYQKKSTNPAKLPSFGIKTPVLTRKIALTENITALVENTGKQTEGVVAYLVKVGEGKSIRLEKDESKKMLSASVQEGDVDIKHLPKTVQSYYQACLGVARKTFKTPQANNSSPEINIYPV